MPVRAGLYDTLEVRTKGLPAMLYTWTTGHASIP